MNSLRFKGPAAYVADIGRSRAFYEGLLGLEVRRVMRRGDRDVAIAYEVGLSIWEAADAYWSIHGTASLAPQTLRGGNWENTFETPEFGEIFDRLRSAGTEFLYELKELPWGQRGFRAFDPDGHIIDISETHGALVRRLHAGGMSKEAIGLQVSLSLEEIDRRLAGEVE